MKTIILVLLISLIACSNTYLNDDSKKVKNNYFHFTLDGEDNLIKFNSEFSSAYYELNWDMSNNLAGNDFISVYFVGVGRNGIATELEFFSNTYTKIDSVLLIDYSGEQISLKTDSSLIINFIDILDFKDFDDNFDFIFYFSY